jgi:hypothetical protein
MEMTMFKRSFFAVGAGSAGHGLAAYLRGHASVDASLAVSFDDFMQATPYVCDAARRVCAPVAPDEVGRALSRFNHGDSGPANGGLILARAGGAIVGFALLRRDRQGRMELSWLYTAEDERRDAVVAALWRAVARTTVAWTSGRIQVSPFVPLPRDSNAAAMLSPSARQHREASGLGFGPLEGGHATGPRYAGFGHG